MTYFEKHLSHLKPTHELIAIRVIIAAGLAATTVGVSLYFVNLGLSNAQVGLFTGGVSLVTAILSLYFPLILEKFNQLKLLIISTVLSGLAFTFFGLSDHLLLAMILFFGTYIATQISLNSLGILFKDSTRSKEEFSRDTGFLGSLANFSWIVGPFFGGLILYHYGFSGLFLASGLLIIIGALYALFFPFKTVTKIRRHFDSSLLKNLRFFISKPGLRIAYIQRLGVSLWWAFLWTYLPIFMLNEGYSESTIGLFIALTQVPLFLLEFLTVRLVPKLGYRKIFVYSYGLLALIGLFGFVLPNFTVVLGLILLGSLSLSFLEPITELFFFEQVSLLEEERAYPYYGTAFSAGRIIAKLGAGLILVFFVEEATFLFIGILMLLVMLTATKIKRQAA